MKYVPARRIHLSQVDALQSAVVRNGDGGFRPAEVICDRWSRTGLTGFDPLWVEAGAILALREDALPQWGHEIPMEEIFVFPIGEHGAKLPEHVPGEMVTRSEWERATTTWMEARETGRMPENPGVCSFIWHAARRATRPTEPGRFMTDGEAHGLAKRDLAATYETFEDEPPRITAPSLGIVVTRHVPGGMWQIIGRIEEAPA